ncbi:MAG: adenylate/guanylate cyclase domain-containing protein [Bacteroidota bacterium]
MKKIALSLNVEEQSYLDEQLTQEIITSERKRAKLLGLISLCLVTAVIIFISLFKEKYLEVVPGLIPAYISIAILLILALREYIMNRMMLKQSLKRIMSNKFRRQLMRYLWIIFEISIPTLILYIYSFYINTPLLLSTPAVWFYFVIIILSTLSLDFYISAVCGFTAAIEYLVLIFVFVETNSNNATADLYGSSFIYHSRCLMLMISGLVAGYVANQLRNRIINTHITLLERNRVVNLFDQQVSREIVDELVTNSGELRSKRKFVCVMFLDIRGFTQFAEYKEPEEIIKYQNEVFSFMIEIITKNNGIINQFLGDGYMATFGAPISKGNDCLNAVRAALEIVKMVNEKSSSGLIPKTQIGIGLHAGDIVAGNVGTDIRKQYSISGNTVILASRIEELNKQYGSQLLVSKEVLENIYDYRIQPVHIGSVQLKGRINPLDIYKLA